MRDDNLKRHLRLIHGNTKNSVQCKEERQQPSNPLIGSQHYNKVQAEGSEIGDSDDMLLNDSVNLKFELQRDNEVYQKNVKIGEQISILLKSENIPEMSLSKQNKFCLELFRAQKPTIDVENTELRLWQDQLLDIIEDNQMDDRKIIWVIGREGNEGKSWFQSYIQSLYGSNRAARFDITNKTADLLHIMSRCALETTDIFLFNHQRCVPSEDCCYSLLEMIKDGYASAPKFHGSLLRIKKPNLIIVFSNRDPRIRSLSYDRWKICLITKDGLILDHEENMWQKQVDDCTVNKNSFRK